MPFTRSTLSEIVERIVADFQTRITGATSLLRRSVLRVIARVNAGAFHLLYEYLDYQARQLFVSTADSAGLEAIASEYGLSRTAAIPAVGSAAVTGTNGVVIPAGSILQTSDGRKYETDANVTIAGGIGTLEITATEAGEDGNDDPGISLTFVSPIAGVSTTATVDSDGLYDGADEESDDDLRARVLMRKRQPPHGGASFDYETWALEYSGVTRAWCIPLYMGVGTVGIAFVRDGDASIFPNATQLAEVLAYIVQHTDPGSGEIVGCPVTAEPGLFMISLTPLSVDFNVSIYPNTSAQQTLVEEALEDMILRLGGPEETIYLSDIAEALSLVENMGYFRINSPVADVTATSTELHVMGTVVFSAY